MLRDLYGGEVGCAIVVIPVCGSYKAKVIHGYNENEYYYADTKSQAIEGLKEKILSGSDFKHYKWMILEPEDLK